MDHAQYLRSRIEDNTVKHSEARAGFNRVLGFNKASVFNKAEHYAGESARLFCTIVELKLALTNYESRTNIDTDNHVMD